MCTHVTTVLIELRQKHTHLITVLIELLHKKQIKNVCREWTLLLPWLSWFLSDWNTSLMHTHIDMYMHAHTRVTTVLIELQHKHAHLITALIELLHTSVDTHARTPNYCLDWGTSHAHRHVHKCEDNLCTLSFSQLQNTKNGTRVLEADCIIRVSLLWGSFLNI